MIYDTIGLTNYCFFHKNKTFDIQLKIKKVDLIEVKVASLIIKISNLSKLLGHMVIASFY